MTNSELAREMMRLAIADAGVTAGEFIDRKDAFLAKLTSEYAEQLKQRALNK